LSKQSLVKQSTEELYAGARSSGVSPNLSVQFGKKGDREIDFFYPYRPFSTDHTVFALVVVSQELKATDKVFKELNSMVIAVRKMALFSLNGNPERIAWYRSE
jgi:hypothetical protein